MQSIFIVMYAPSMPGLSVTFVMRGCSILSMIYGHDHVIFVFESIYVTNYIYSLPEVSEMKST